MSNDEAGHSGDARRINALTGIRGVACIWVIALHTYPIVQKLFDLAPENQVQLVRTGYLAVDMFFILSGFILTYKYDGRLAFNNRAQLSRFLVSRIFRIFPLNWFMLAVLLATAYFLPTKGWAFATLDWMSFIASVFLMQSWGFSDPVAWNFPAWSMSTEWAAYLLFPAMLLATWPRLGGLWAVFGVAISLSVLAAVMIVFGQATLDHTGLLSLPRCFLQFFAGIYLCRMYRRDVPLPASIMMVGGVLALAAAIFDARLELVAPFAFCLMILSCAQDGGPPEFLFGNRVIVFLGEISFSLYMTHIFLIYVFQVAADGTGIFAANLFDKAVFTGVMTVALLGVPIATWRYVELPGQALGRRINQRNRLPALQSGNSTTA